MDRSVFENEVVRLVRALPEEFRLHLDDVLFIVEDRPDEALLFEAGYGPGEELLGFFRGYPLGEKQHDIVQVEPDMIYLFQDAIELEASESGLPVERVIRETLLHEIAHFFGFSEEDMERTERFWAEQ